MKVLYITNYGTMYGANRSLYNMICLLKNEYDIEPYVLASGGGPIVDLCENEGIQCFCEDFRISAVNENIKHKNLKKITRRIMRYKEFISFAKKIERLGIKFDIIHSNSSIFDIGLFLARRWRLPHVWHIREFAKEDYGLESIFTKREMLKQYRMSDAVIAISDAIKDRVNSYGEGVKTFRIYNGIDVCEKYKKNYCNEGIVRFCIVGSIKEQKGQFDCVKACDLLKQKNIDNFRFYIVGGIGGLHFKQIEEYIDEHPGIKENIVFTGYCDNVDEFLKNMDVGIMASYEEAFGRVTVEYMSNYMPVIGTNTGGTPEILTEEGRFFEPADIVGLSKHMEDLVKHKEKIQTEGEKARRTAEKFTKERNVKEIYNMYKDLI